MNVLIVFATTEGQTRKIAQFCANQCIAQGHSALVTRAGDPINTVDPHSIEIGAAVQVVFDPVTDEVHMPRWVLA